MKRSDWLFPLLVFFQQIISNNCLQRSTTTYSNKGSIIFEPNIYVHLEKYVNCTSQQKTHVFPLPLKNKDFNLLIYLTSSFIKLIKVSAIVAFQITDIKYAFQ